MSDLYIIYLNFDILRFSIITYSILSRKLSSKVYFVSNSDYFIICFSKESSVQINRLVTPRIISLLANI